jgi:hypothetical protein
MKKAGSRVCETGHVVGLVAAVAAGSDKDVAYLEWV